MLISGKQKPSVCLHLKLCFDFIVPGADNFFKDIDYHHNSDVDNKYDNDSDSVNGEDYDK